MDGAMGSLIQECGLTESDFRGKRFADFPFDVKGNNDLLSITQPHIIRMIHDKYLAAGSDIIETNTFNANRFSQADYHLEEVVREMNRESARIARNMAAVYTERDPERPRFVAGAMGPTNKTTSLSPDVNNPGFRAVTFDEMVDVYDEQASGLIETLADTLLQIEPNSFFPCSTQRFNSPCTFLTLSGYFSQNSCRMAQTAKTKGKAVCSYHTSLRSSRY